MLKQKRLSALFPIEFTAYFEGRVRGSECAEKSLLCNQASNGCFEERKEGVENGERESENEKSEQTLFDNRMYADKS